MKIAVNEAMYEVIDDTIDDAIEDAVDDAIENAIKDAIYDAFDIPINGMLLKTLLRTHGSTEHIITISSCWATKS